MSNAYAFSHLSVLFKCASADNTRVFLASVLKTYRRMRHKPVTNMWLALVLAVLLFSSCTTEDATHQSLQVANQEVVFNLFESSISDLETRGDGSSTSLAASKLFSELEIAMIPDGKEKVDTNLVVRQDTTQKDFGQVKMYVPAGKYHLVAVASNTHTPFDRRIDIKSTQEIDFPNDKVCDMAYLYKDVNITAKSTNIDCQLKRGVCSLLLHSIDRVSSAVKSVSVEISGNCGNVFNPSTGHCASTTNIAHTFDLGQYFYGKTITITFFLVLKDDDEPAIKVKLKSIDQNNQVIRSYNFDSVHLVVGKKTQYNGPFFSSATGASFTIGEPIIPSSGYDQNFE